MDTQFTKTLPRDVFLYLLATIGIIFGSIALGNLLFGLINNYVPDPLQQVYGVKDSMRWSIAVLIVLVPVYYFVMRFLSRDIKANPAKQDMLVRKWLLYLTVFIAAGVMIGDGVAVIYQFLQGELTTTFFLKMLSMFVIAGGVFYYYRNIISHEVTKPAFFKAFPVVAGIFVLVVAVIGVIAAGLPQDARLAKFDQKRVTDLMGIQNSVTEYWRTHRGLPNSLNDLSNLYVSINDPKTNALYEYRKTGDLSFDLCANFETSNKDQANPGNTPLSVVDKSWLHDAGRQCIPYTIDPLNYPVNGPSKTEKPIAPVLQ